MSGVDNAPPEGRLAGPRYLSGTEAAVRLGVRPATWRAYVARGQAPPADAWVGDVPGWLPATLDGWVRPGQGARTDKH